MSPARPQGRTGLTSYSAVKRQYEAAGYSKSFAAAMAALWEARRRWIGDGEDMSCQRAARIEDRHEVARRRDPFVLPSCISNDSDVKCFQQWTRRFQPTGGVVVA
jgi:hypothetical protein